MVAAIGWDDLTFTHITVRGAGRRDQFLINPYGLFFDEITASSLVKIDLQGNKIGDSPFPVNRRASSSTAPSTTRATTRAACCTPTP